MRASVLTAVFSLSFTTDGTTAGGPKGVPRQHFPRRRGDRLVPRGAPAAPAAPGGRHGGHPVAVRVHHPGAFSRENSDGFRRLRYTPRASFLHRAAATESADHIRCAVLFCPSVQALRDLDPLGGILQGVSGPIKEYLKGRAGLSLTLSLLRGRGDAKAAQSEPFPVCAAAGERRTPPEPSPQPPQPPPPPQAQGRDKVHRHHAHRGHGLRGVTAGGAGQGERPRRRGRRRRGRRALCSCFLLLPFPVFRSASLSLRFAPSRGVHRAGKLKSPFAPCGCVCGSCRGVSAAGADGAEVAGWESWEPGDSTDTARALHRTITNSPANLS